MKKILIVVISIWSLYSCQDVVEVDIDPGPDRIVVEGSITDIPNAVDTIKISRSIDFYGEEGPSGISNATVTISDDGGSMDTLTEFTAGKYITSPTYRGQAGNTYELTIETPEGTVYKSDPVIMVPVPEFDTIFLISAFNYSDTLGFPEILRPDENRWIVTANFYDTPGMTNYYMWRAYTNGQLENDSSNIAFARDDFFGRVDGDYWNLLLNFDYDWEEGDSIHVQQMSITKEEFEFYNSLLASENESAFSAFFGTPPAPVESNIYNVADENELTIGFFGASSVVSESFIIPEAPPQDEN